MGEDYLLNSATFNTVADTSPNRYTISTVTTVPVNAFDVFGKIRYMERVIDDSTGSYERIPEIRSIADKEFLQDILQMLHIDLSVSPASRPRGYFLGRDFIQLEPISDAVYTLRVWFLAYLADITATNTEITELPQALEDTLVLEAAVEERIARHMQTEDLRERIIQTKDMGLLSLEERTADGPSFINFLHDPGDYI